MSKPAFTPGPWEAIYVDGEGKHEIRMASALENPSNHYTCHLVEYDHGAYDDDEPDVIAEPFANAHLIAAAPDLYEACAEFVRKVEAGEARSNRSYEQMKAALAKAHGEATE